MSLELNSAWMTSKTETLCSGHSEGYAIQGATPKLVSDTHIVTNVRTVFPLFATLNKMPDKSYDTIKVLLLMSKSLTAKYTVLGPTTS